MFPVTLQKSFNLAFEAPPNSDGASPYLEQAVMHFLFALERYLRTLPAAKATAVEQKIKDHEMRFRRPNDLCVLQELQVHICKTGIVVWYGKASDRSLAFVGKVDLECLYRFARAVLPRAYFSVSHIEWGLGRAPITNILLEGA